MFKYIFEFIKINWDSIPNRYFLLFKTQMKYNPKDESLFKAVGNGIILW